MGCGIWKSGDFEKYSRSKGRSVDKNGRVVDSSQQIFTERALHKDLSPFQVMRECCDTAEHPESLPVIIGIDVTGSMGRAAKDVAQSMNVIITGLMSSVKDIEVCVMGIGDLAYDQAPIQISQFESDIRISEHLDKIYFEGGGGGNQFESYTAAWYMGLKHCKLDCWKRGKKGIIITIGDEPLNPYLPKQPLINATGDELADDVMTNKLYEEASKKFSIYSIYLDNHPRYSEIAPASYKNILPESHVLTIDAVDKLTEAIQACIRDGAGEAAIGVSTATPHTDSSDTSGMVSW